MNNFMISAKRFITNKNTVTIIGVLIVLIILYWGYKSTIDSAVNPVNVPVANKLIGPQTEITSSDIEWKVVASAGKPSSVLMNESDIVGKYTAVNATIPEGSMFYSDVLVNFEDLPGTWLKKIKTDVNGVIDIPYYLSVNMVTSFGNAIQPDTYIDIYMKAKDESELVIWGKLIDNVQVLAVKDMSGEDVFKDVSSDAVPAYLYFGVPAELHDLLRKALYLQPKGVEIVVVPHGGANPVTGDVEIRSAYLRDYIDALSAVVPTDEEYVTTLDGNTPNTNTNTNTNQ